MNSGVCITLVPQAVLAYVCKFVGVYDSLKHVRRVCRALRSAADRSCDESELTISQPSVLVPSLFHIIPRCCHNLETLTISDVGISKCLISVLADCIKQHAGTLRSICFKRVGLGDHLMRTVAPAIGLCKELARLDLPNNNIIQVGLRVLCNVLSQLPRLEYLSLADNNIDDDIATAALASALQQCSSIKSINLKFGWEGLSPELPRLYRAIGQHLSLEEATLQAPCSLIAEALRGSPNIKVLRAHAGRYSGDGIPEFAHALSQCKQLRTLEFVWTNDVPLNAHSASLIALAIAQCSTLQGLTFANRFNSEEASKAFFDTLTNACKAPSLRSFSTRVLAITAGARMCAPLVHAHASTLGSLDFGSDHVHSPDALFRALASCSHLTSLHFNWRGLNSAAAECLADALAPLVASTLRTLDMSFIDSDAPAVLKVLKTLRFFSSTPPHYSQSRGLGNTFSEAHDRPRECPETARTECLPLEDLSLSIRGNGLPQSEFASLFAGALPRLSRLRSISLYLDAQALRGAATTVTADMMRALSHCGALTDLHFYYSVIDTEAAIALSESLPHLTDLETLLLAYASLQDKGGSHIARAVKQLASLRELCFTGNRVSDLTAGSLAESLPFLYSLCELDLEDNQIHAQGATVLASALPAAPCLSRLFLSENPIGEEGGNAIAAAISGANARCLRELDLRWTGLTEANVTAFQGAVSGLRYGLRINLSLNGITSMPNIVDIP